MNTDAFVELVTTAGENLKRSLGAGVAYAFVAYNAAENEYHVWVPDHIKPEKVPDLMREALRAVQTPEEVRKTRE